MKIKPFADVEIKPFRDVKIEPFADVFMETFFLRMFLWEHFQKSYFEQDPWMVGFTPNT